MPRTTGSNSGLSSRGFVQWISLRGCQQSPIDIQNSGVTPLVWTRTSHARRKRLKSHLIGRTIELTMANLNHISVEIDANFGSSFQEETALRMLEKVVRSWKEFHLSKHSKNQIRFRITNVETVPTARESAEG
jgi:hypothetical protein